MSNSRRYNILAGETTVENTIQRSRFIATLAPTPTVDDAKAFIARVRSSYADATHNCWAYLVGEPGSSANIGMSDDGEPHSTAGRPMLNVLNHCGLGDLSVVVTRYFGGVKLGKGGLVRAYSGSVKLALEQAVLCEKIEWVQLEVELEYKLHEPLKLLYPQYEAEVLEEVFAAEVTHNLRVPQDRADEFEKALLEKSLGNARLRRLK